MKEMTKKEHLMKLHRHLTHYNRMAPFNIYDSEYVEKVNEEINKYDNDYDAESVVACTYCNSLHITLEDNAHGEQVDVCNRCFSVGETREFANIHEYNEYLKQYDETED